MQDEQSENSISIDGVEAVEGDVVVLAPEEGAELEASEPVEEVEESTPEADLSEDTDEAEEEV